MASEMLLIIDCDCGIDDALAILLAITQKKKWSILAITCTYGNTSLDNACNNVGKILQFCGETQIPIYKGCPRPLIKECNSNGYHGKDGFGNVGHEYPHDQAAISSDHAVNALINLAKKHKSNGVHLVSLGPMTNIAMAHRLDPEFTKNLKSLHFMGGNFYEIGDAIPEAEFNFSCDPEAANIILTESHCPVNMVPWETTLKHGMPWDEYEKWVNSGTVFTNYIRHITQNLAELCKDDNMTFVDCDFLAMAALISPNSIKKSELKQATVDTQGRTIIGENKNQNIINIITEFCDTSLINLRTNMSLENGCTNK